AILFTSGTTGPSKGVRNPHAQLYWWGVNVAELLEVDEDDVLYTCLPLFHINAINTFFQALVTGAGYHLDTRFSASRFWDRVNRSGATVTYLLGAMIPILLKQEPNEAERSHALRLAHGPGPPEETAKVLQERFGISIAECYASTETNCVIGPALSDQRAGYAGPAFPGFEVDVVDADEQTVPDGMPGELIVRHTEPFAMATGYFELPEATVDAWRNLWFHTGDRVVREPDGFIRFLDRLKDAIRRSGENISSHEVEQVLMSHPDVASTAVFAVPAELGEDEVMVAVVPRKGAKIDPLELVKHCEPRLAYFAIPRYIDVVEELPMTENGKVRKFMLRDRGVTEATWDIEQSGYRVARPTR
ncbi:MAG: AMP-binding protein, partial [Solirubrobacterales bacterium]